MKGYRIGAIAASAVLTVSLAAMCHEAGHVLAGRMAGGSPTLITATETKGDFDALSPAGFVALGISGSLVNVVFAALGWWALRRRPATAEGRLTAWFFFGVNGMIAALKMMGEPMMGFGDWMTILKPFPALGATRVAAAAAGTVAVAFMVRRSGAALSGLLPSGDPPRRRAEALRVISIGALASSVLLLIASVMSPLGLTRATLLALAAGLGPFFALLFGVRFVRGAEPEASEGAKPGGWPWYLGAVAVTSLLWFVVGPGLDVSKLLP